MKKFRRISKTTLIIILIFAVSFTTMVSANPPQEEFALLSDNGEGTFVTFRYYDKTFIEAMSNVMGEENVTISGEDAIQLGEAVNINMQEVFKFLVPMDFYHAAGFSKPIHQGFVEFMGNLEDRESEMQTERIILREGPADGYKIIATLERSLEDPEQENPEAVEQDNLEVDGQDKLTDGEQENIVGEQENIADGELENPADHEQDNPETGEKYAVLEEINNYLLIQTESLEGWVKKSEVRRIGVMEELSLRNVQVIHNYLNFRQGPSTSEKVLDQVNAGEIYPLIEDNEEWFKIQKGHQVGWVSKGYAVEIEAGIPEEMYQFLHLTSHVPSGITEEEILQLFRQWLPERKAFENFGKVFLEAGEVTGLNEVYLLALAMENYKESTAGFYEGWVVDQVAGSTVEPKTVYNFFGIGASELEPQKSVAETAYEKGWFTPEQAIMEGAEWILRNHIQIADQIQSEVEPDTLHKMLMQSYMELVDRALVEGKTLADSLILSQEDLEVIEKDLRQHQDLRIRIKDIYDEFDLNNRRFMLPVFEQNRYWPVPGFQRISSDFGYRKDPFEGDIRFHRAIDIPAPMGTPIVAVTSGVVTKNFLGESYGNLIEINHGHGIIARYAHNAENLVKVGDFVEKGDLIATVGSTGRSTGPHLHFELHINGLILDPLPWFGEQN